MRRPALTNMSGKPREPTATTAVSAIVADPSFPFRPASGPVAGAAKWSPLPYRVVAGSFAAFIRDLLPRLLSVETMSPPIQIKILLLLCGIDEQLHHAGGPSIGRTRQLCESLSQLIFPSLHALDRQTQLEYRAWLRWYLDESSP